MSDSEGQTLGSEDTNSVTNPPEESRFTNPTSDSIVLEQGGPKLRATNQTCRFMCRISNPTEDDFEKLRRFARTHCSYLVCGQIETTSYVKTIFEWVKGDPTTPHCHFYFEVMQRTRWTAFQKKDVLGKGYRFENARECARDCVEYCLKGVPATIESGIQG